MKPANTTTLGEFTAAKCSDYAGLMHSWKPAAVWSAFGIFLALLLVCLLGAGVCFIQTEKKRRRWNDAENDAQFWQQCTEAGKSGHEIIMSRKTEFRTSLKKSILPVAGFLALSVIFLVFLTIAMRAIHWCLELDHIVYLFWAWGQLGVGIPCAILGILLIQVYHLNFSYDIPPWALAMGTPVLVLAGLLSLFVVILRSALFGWEDDKKNEVVPNGVVILEGDMALKFPTPNSGTFLYRRLPTKLPHNVSAYKMPSGDYMVCFGGDLEVVKSGDLSHRESHAYSKLSGKSFDAGPSSSAASSSSRPLKDALGRTESLEEKAVENHSHSS